MKKLSRQKREYIWSWYILFGIPGIALDIFYGDKYSKRFAIFQRSDNIYFLPSMTKHQKIYVRRKRKNGKALGILNKLQNIGRFVSLFAHSYIHLFHPLGTSRSYTKVFNNFFYNNSCHIDWLSNIFFNFVTIEEEILPKNEGHWQTLIKPK